MIRNESALTQAYIVRCHLAVEQFKVCPLCESVNVADNDACFSCGWAGKFQTEPHRIESRLYDLIYRCPELLAILVDEERVHSLTLFERLKGIFSRFRRLDVSA